MYMYICLCMCMHLYLCYAPMCIYVLCLYIYLCIYISMNVAKYVGLCMRACVYVYNMYLGTYLYKCIRINEFYA